MIFCTTDFLVIIFTTRKRSLGQGNIFTPVCHSVHKGGHVWLVPGGVHGCSGGHAWLLGGHAWLLRGVCMVALGGMRGCSGGACVVARGHAWLLAGGVCMVAPGGACMGYGEIWRCGQWAGSTHPTGMHSRCWCVHMCVILMKLASAAVNFSLHPANTYTLAPLSVSSVISSLFYDLVSQGWGGVGVMAAPLPARVKIDLFWSYRKISKIHYIGLENISGEFKGNADVMFFKLLFSWHYFCVSFHFFENDWFLVV